MRKIGFLAVALLVLAGCGDKQEPMASGTSDARTYTLRLKPTEGPVNYDFSVDLVAKVGEGKTDETGKIFGRAALEIKDAGDGKLTMSWKVTDLKMEKATVFFQAVGPILIGELEKEQSTTTTATGQSLDEGKTPVAFGLNLPEGPVKVGDTWEGKRKGPDGKDVPVSGKVVSEEGGKLRLEVTGVSLSKELTATKPMVVILDPTTGIAEDLTMDLDINRSEIKGTAMVHAKRIP